MFNNELWRRDSIIGQIIPKTQKWYLIPQCFTLSIIWYASKVKWHNPGKELCPPLHHGVVAIEKGAFGSSCTTVANEGSNGCHPRKAKLFAWIELSVAIEWIHVNKTKVIHKRLKCPRRCPWCNGYRRRKWIRWHEFKSETRLLAFHIALIPLGKVWIQFSLSSYG